MVHHGSDRITQNADFQAACQQHDVIITSFTLARKDEKLLNSVEWQRLVLDEAQNIKNPKAAQTKAILKISAKHRLALTGTPKTGSLGWREHVVASKMSMEQTPKLVRTSPARDSNSSCLGAPEHPTTAF